jgi:hypothetical protein
VVESFLIYVHDLRFRGRGGVGFFGRIRPQCRLGQLVAFLSWLPVIDGGLVEVAGKDVGGIVV